MFTFDLELAKISTSILIFFIDQYMVITNH